MDIKQTLMNLPSAKLKKATLIKERIEALHAELESLLSEVTPKPLLTVINKRRSMSAAARKKIADSARARWAKVKTGSGKA